VTVVQTVLTFVGIPLAIVAVVTVAVYGRSMIRQPNRYRPGKPWNYEPSWYVPHPEAVTTAAGSSGAGSARAITGAVPTKTTTTTAVGGASGEW
jgi:hypothetical protein